MITPTILGPDGRPWRKTYGDQPLPHALGFAGMYTSSFNVYYGEFDEARRRSLLDAELMRRDCFLMALLDERKRDVASLNWHLAVEDETDPDQRNIRDHLDKAVRAIPSVNRIFWELLEYLWYGRYGVQVLWTWVNRRGIKTLTVDPLTFREVETRGPDVRTLTVKSFDPVNGDKIRFQLDGTPYITVYGGTEIPGAEEISGTPIGSRGVLLKGSWRQRFIIAQAELEDADFFNLDRAEAVYGVGIRDKIFWVNFQRLSFLQMIEDHLGKTGLGITLFLYEEGNAAAEAEAIKAANDQSGQVRFAVPVKSATGRLLGGVERVEVPVNGIAVLNEMMIPQRSDIERFVLGQEASGRSQAQGLGNEEGMRFQRDTAQKRAMIDADRLEEVLTGTAEKPGLMWMMQSWTFPGSTPEHGGFRCRFKFDVETKGNKEGLDAGKTLWEMGVDIKADEAREKGGFSKPSPHDEIVKAKPEPVAPGIPGAEPFGGGDPDETGDDVPETLRRRAAALAYVRDANGAMHDEEGLFTGDGGGTAVKAEKKPVKDKEGNGWVQAKKGGEVSPVDGLFYKGGQWMPIHGLSPKKDKNAKKPDEPAQPSTPPKPNEDAEGRGRHL